MNVFQQIALAYMGYKNKSLFKSLKIRNVKFYISLKILLNIKGNF